MVSIPARSLIVASAFLSFAAFSAPVRAQGVMDAVLGILGIDEEDKPEIDYRERAPLVVPPKMVLRPPEASPIAGNPAWPQDPDVQRRKAVAAQKKLPGGMTDEERKRLNGDRAAMGEVQASRSGGGTRYNLPAEQNTFDDSKNKRADWLRPDVLAAESRAAELQTAKSGVEPDRRYLTDPPAGLRKPSANAEFKAPKTGPAFTEEDSSPMSLYKPKKQEF